MSIKIDQELISERVQTSPPGTGSVQAVSSSSKESVFTKQAENKSSAQSTSETQNSTPSAKPEVTNVSEDRHAADQAPKGENALEVKLFEYIKNNNIKDLNGEEIISRLKQKQLRGEQLTKEEQEILNLQKAVSETPHQNQANISSESAETYRKYNEFKNDKSKTAYQQASNALDKYLSEHDDKYKSLKTNKEKQAYRDKQISELIKKLCNAKDSKSVKGSARTSAFMQITNLCAYADTQNININNLLAMNGSEMTQKAAESEQNMMQVITKTLNIYDNTKSIDEKFQDLAQKALANIPKLKNKTKEEMELLVLSETAKQMNIIFGDSVEITAEDLKPGKNTFLKETYAALLTVLNKGDEKLGLNEFQKMSAKQQAKYLMEAFKETNIEERIKNFPKDEQLSARKAVAKTRIIAEEINKENVTDRDVLNYLNSKKDSELTDAEKSLRDELKFYENNPKIIDKKADFKNISTASLFIGKSEKEIYQEQIASCKKDIDTYLKTGKMSNHLEKVLRKAAEQGHIGTISAILKEQNINRADYEKMLKAARVKSPEDYLKSAAKEASEHRPEAFAEVTNIAHSCLDKKDNEIYLESAKVAFSIFNNEESAQAILALDVDNKPAMDSYNAGIHKYKSKEDCSIIATNVVNSDKVNNEFKAAYTESFIEQAPAQNQVYYAKELAKTNNAAVIEGLAAASDKVTNKQEYTQVVQTSVANGNFTQEEVSRINTAMQTGEVSRSLNETSAGSASAGTSVSERGTSQTRTTTSFKTSTTSAGTAQNMQADAAASRYSTSVTSNQNHDTNYADQVTKTLEAKKEDTKQRLEEIISNFQKSKVEQEKAKPIPSSTETKNQDTTKNVNDYIDEVSEFGNIPAEVIKELKAASSAGDFAKVYRNLASLGANMQEKFLAYFAKYADSTSLHAFASSFSSDRNIILALYQSSNDASLLSYLDGASIMDLLSKGKIKLQDFLKYASPSTIASYIIDLNNTGNKNALKQIYELLNDYQASYVRERSALKTQPVPGSDEWNRLYLSSMASVSPYDAKEEISTGTDFAMGSGKLPMRGDYDKMKKRGPFYYSA